MKSRQDHQQAVSAPAYAREERVQFRDIFENAGVSVWLEDFSLVKAALDELRSEGVTDFRAYFEAHPEFVRRAIGLVQIIDVNQETLDLLAAEDKSQLLGSLATIFTPPTEEVFREELVAICEGRRSMKSESPLRTLDGRMLSVLLTVDFGPPADELRRVVVTLTDITRRKQVEMALRQSEERARLAMEITQLGTWHYDPSANRFHLDERMRAIWGQPEAVESMPVAEALQRIHPSDRERVERCFADALDPAGDGRYALEYRVVCPDGRTRWLSANGQARFEGRGAQRRPVALVGTAQDVTGRKQREEELRRLNEALEQRVAERTQALERQNQRLRQLANQLSETEQRERRRLAKTLHDGLQQILIAGKMQLALLGNEPAAEDVDHLKQLFDEAIEISRSLTYEFSPPVLYNSGLPAALQWLAGWFQANHHFAVDLQVDDGFPLLPEQIKTFLFDAVRELLFNAVKHSGDKRAKVELRSGPSDQLSIIVTDQGRGFDPEELEREDQALTGFGLFSIRERILALGGSSQFQSQPGEGTRSILSMSLAREEQQIQLPDTGPLTIDPDSPSSLVVVRDRPIRVLVADDHGIVRKGLIAFLEREGEIELVGEAEDGVEAVKRTEELRPDVVIMDVDMPRLDGIDATRRIKRRHPEIAVVALSFHEEEVKREAMLRAGASAYLRKGTDVEMLLTTIRELV